MNVRDPDWLRRILDAEDLAPAERNELESLLVAEPAARRVLDRLRALERFPSLRGEIGMPPQDAFSFASPEERRQAEESLRLLLARVVEPKEIPARPHRPAPSPRKSWWRRFEALLPPPVLVPAAVGVLALLFFRFSPSVETLPGTSPLKGGVEGLSSAEPSLPGAGVPEGETPAGSSGPGTHAPPAPGRPLDDDRPAFFRSWSIHPGSVSRGGIQAESSEGAVSRGSWRTGDAFFLRFDLDQDGSVVLYHVDPRGLAERLFPADPDAPSRVFRAGTSLELPLPESGEEWVFEGEPGIETFLLAMGDPATWNPKSAISKIDGAALSPETAEEAVARIQRALKSDGGFVRVLRVDHRAVEERAP